LAENGFLMHDYLNAISYDSGWPWGYGKTTASEISSGLSIAADKEIPQAPPSSIVMTTCTSADFFDPTAF
jgi:hypothetical protein